MRFEEIANKIESYRESLKQKKTLIEVVDFGAGKPDEKRTKEQMEAGVTLEISLCELAKIGVKREKAEVIFKIFNDKNLAISYKCITFALSNNKNNN